MKSNKNIVLIGMMGSGKSSIGKILSKKLNLTFIDIDQKIEETEDSKISEIFTKYGEKYFRKIEEKISLKFLSSENLL
jgi:Shikimate kinase